VIVSETLGDIYAFGRILWEMLMLRRPFDGCENWNYIMFIVTNGRHPEESLPDIPGQEHPDAERMRIWCTRATALDPRERPDALQFLKEIL
jgi:serine/threonine protein kinase